MQVENSGEEKDEVHCAVLCGSLVASAREHEHEGEGEGMGSGREKDITMISAFHLKCNNDSPAGIALAYLNLRFHRITGFGRA